MEDRAGPALRERDTEMAAMGDRIGAACAGGGSLLVVRGPAGIGKTSLLDAAAQQGCAQRMRVLRATGGPLEADFPYGIVRQLFEPLRATAPPERWARLTRDAAGLASIVLDEPAAAPHDDVTHAAVHGLYWLAANLAADEPVLVTVDDVQWADPASLRWLAYLARRLAGLGVLLLIGLRTGEPAADQDVLAELLAGAALLRPAPLGAAAVAALARERLGPGASDAFCAACLEVTGGNPFLLHVLLATLSSESSAADDVAATSLSTFGVDEVTLALDRRLARLPDGSRELLEAVAVLGTDARPQTAATLAGLAPASAVTAADALRAADILIGVDALRLAHPLLRASALTGIPPGRLSALHARAASLLRAASAPADRIAPHLLATEPADDPAVVETLREAARIAGDRGAPYTGSRYLRRALAESPAAEVRAELLLALGLAATAQREPDAAASLYEAVEAFPEPGARAAAALRAAEALGSLSRHEAAARLGVDVLADADADDLDPECRRRLVVQCALNAGLASGVTAAEVAGHVGKEMAHPATGTAADAQLAALEAMAAALRGDPAGVGLDTAVADGVFDRQASLITTMGIMALLYTDRLPAAERLCAETLDAAERAGSLSGITHMRYDRALIAFRCGELAEAEVNARFAYEYKLATNAAEALPAGIAALLDVLIERGELAEAERLLAESGSAATTLESTASAVLLERRGRLRRAQGRLVEAARDLRAAGDELDARGLGSPSVGMWAPDLALTLAALGDAKQARALAAETLERAQRCGSAWAVGIALRTVGLLDGPAGLDTVRDSIDTLAPSPFRLEHARSLVDLGATLRRDGRRAQAREPLRDGMDRAHRLGATALAERAREELLAAGARPRRTALVGAAALTARELQVAQLAATGLTNREIAQRLFVTERTVESHLLAGFAKLGINRRRDLTPGLLDPAATQSAPPG